MGTWVTRGSLGRCGNHHCAAAVQLRRLVFKGVSLNTTDAAGYTALHHAVLAGDLTTVLMCLPKRSPIGEMTEVTAEARDGLTPLHIAAKDRNPQVAHAIVAYANWMVRSVHELHPRHLSASLPPAKRIAQRTRSELQCN